MRLLNPPGQLDAVASVEADELVITVTREELVGLANSIGEALLAIDDWEFDTRVGLLPDDARSLRDAISGVLRAAFEPE